MRGSRRSTLTTRQARYACQIRQGESLIAKYFEDIDVGYRSLVGTWRLSAEEIIEFARVWDPQPFHIDPAAARASIFGGLVASSLHLFAIATRLFFDHEDCIQIAAMLGKDQIRLPNPTRADVVLTYDTHLCGSAPAIES
jgi:acyl dehydratase